jgi:UDP-N-acetylmuramoylalanine--D-glutamate ligase
MSYIAELKSKNILIVGGGTTGKAISNYLTGLGANFSIFDENSTTNPELEVVKEILDYAIYDLAIVSPGWRQDHSVISTLQSNGVEVISELDFAWTLKSELSPNQTWLAVTGTNGKTTTIQMLESILISAGVSGIAC